MPARNITLDDKYLQEEGEVFLTCMQALVRLPLLQRAGDRLQGRRTAGFISGYRGSPLGGYDRELARARDLLLRHDVHFQPGLNEDLAAAACWGTQQVQLFPDPKVEGVFSIWYGKAPGLDRSMDAIKHATHAGTSPLGGVLAVVGDDHLAKSSAFGHQSEFAFVDALMPVLVPYDLGEVLEFGLFGFALSRYCGSWVGMKLAGSLCESSATVRLPDPSRQSPLPTDFDSPPGGLHLRWPDDAAAMEHRAKSARRQAVHAFVRTAGVDRIEGAIGPARLGLAACGRTYGVLRESLRWLGLQDADLRALGIRLYKPAVVWPLEPIRALEFLQGLETVLVVEDKRPLLEDQLKVILHDQTSAGPRIIGKRDQRGAPLLPESGEIEPVELARLLVDRFGLPARGAGQQAAPTAPADQPLAARTPYFCAGCPHNTSTRIPQGKIAIGGIGCHTLAMYMERGMCTFAHMGGEGATWIGIAPFTGTRHVFQNMGDGTYQHSGSMGIRAALAASVNVTFKILYNDAVAMTGGQAIEGQPTVPQITRELAAEGVQAIAVVTDEPQKYGRDAGFAAGVTVHCRDEIDAVQRRLAELPGVTALVYDQTCAAEKRRRRKAGTLPTPARRVVINELVCEGCGDCGVQSNCVAIIPLETEFGTKRAVEQAACNLDYSCLKGFCPSFLTVEGGQPRRSPPRAVDDLPAPPHVPLVDGAVRRILLAGVGGTGIVTVGAILGVAARLEGLAVRVNDVTGMAQKGGAVFGHVQIAASPDAITTDKIPPGKLDLLLAADLVVAAMPESALRIAPVTQVIANTDTAETGRFTRDRDSRVDVNGLVAQLARRAGRLDTVPAVRAATAAAGEPLGAGLLLLGFATQRNLLPLMPESIVRAIQLNGGAVERNLAAFRWGRRLAADPAARLELGLGEVEELDLETRLSRRVAFLAAYQDAAWAARYRALIERTRAKEAERVPGSDALALAVLEAAFKLMSYKDEYEVARLHADPAFRHRLETSFEGSFRLRYHLAPPLLARTDPTTGVPRKIEFGAWMGTAFRLLAPFKRLRGTPLDPFGWTAERRLERRLIEDYVALVDQLLAGLGPGNHAIAVALASLPAEVRGFGHIKLAAVQRMRERERELLVRWAESSRPGPTPG
jgi:indolepyruvate ferredoxin oxidoreductase